MTPQQDAKQTIILSWVLALVGIVIFLLVAYGGYRLINFFLVKKADTIPVTKYEETVKVFPPLDKEYEMTPCPADLLDANGDCLDKKG